MPNVNTQQWEVKDSWDKDVQKDTGNTYGGSGAFGERDVDWMLEEQEFPYNKNDGTLTCKFKRKLVGSTEHDYTMLLNVPMEVRWAIGVFDNE